MAIHAGFKAAFHILLKEDCGSQAFHLCEDERYPQ
jgi:hypothetical protein